MDGESHAYPQFGYNRDIAIIVKHGAECVTERRVFTDSQIWIILHTGRDVSNAQIAEALGRSVHSVRWLRSRLRHHPWACKISWEPCRECGDPLIRPTSKKLFHDRCRPAARRQWLARRQKIREEQLTDQEREERRARGAAFHAAVQERTAAVATNHGGRWSEEDNEYLVNQYQLMPLFEVALELGRTYGACHSRLSQLRKRGLIV